MKRKIVSFALACCFLFSGIWGNIQCVSAANTENRAFSFDNSGSSGTGAWRDKNNSSKVYVHPLSGPDIYYTVQGRANTSAGGTKRSSKVVIPQGIEGSITNYVKENNGIQARLKYDRITYGYVLTKGNWSPDSTRNYTIFGS